MTATTNTKSKKKSIKPEDFQIAYLDHLLTHGVEPASVFVFAKNLKSSEDEFYENFNSFSSLERSIWRSWFEKTVEAIEADDAYPEYSVREKTLAFYFTWLENLKKNRSYVLLKSKNLKRSELTPDFLEGLHHHFKAFINDLIIEGKDTSEVAERPFSSQYEKVFWLHFMFVLKFWVNDDSASFEKTDAAIEKSVNLAFDLVGKGALDSMLDFGKFLFQNRS